MLQRALVALLSLGIVLDASAQSKVSSFTALHPKAKVKLDRKDRVVLVQDPEAPVYPGSAADAAGAYLKDIAPLFDGEALGTPKVFEAAGRTIVHFPQMIGSVPVLGRGVSVTLQGNQPKLLARKIQPSAIRSALDPKPSFDSDIAAILANEAVGNDDRAKSVVTLGFLPLADTQVLVYQVQTIQGLNYWHVYIDAKNGGVVWKEDRLMSVKAKIYESNPGADQTESLLDVDLPALLEAPSAGQGLSGEFVQALSCTAPFNAQVFGPGFSTCTPSGVAFPDANGDLIFNPVFDRADPSFNQDPFAQVHMFFHVDRIHSFFQDLGVTDEVGQVLFPDQSCCTNLDSPLLSITDFRFSANQSFNNAAFAGFGIIFGNGSNADFSYDADVIYHEYTHAVISFLLAGFRFDSLGLDLTSGGLNEGTADIFATLFLNDPELSEFALAELGAGRNLDNNKEFPQALNGEVHDDGEIWGGSFWELKTRYEQEIGPDIGGDAVVHNLLARIYTATLFNLPTNAADFGESAQVLISTAEDLGGDFSPAVGAEAAQIAEEVFVERGVLDNQGNPSLRIVPIDPPNVSNASVCGLLAPGGFCQLGIGRSRVGASADEPVPGTLQYSATVPPGQELHARVAAITGFGTPASFNIFVNEGSPVDFEISFAAGYSITVNAQQTLDEPDEIILQNFTDEPKTFFFAFGMLDADANGFGLFATVTDISLQEAALPPDTFFTGGGCATSPSSSSPWVFFLLVGLVFVLRKRR